MTTITKPTPKHHRNWTTVNSGIWHLQNIKNPKPNPRTIARVLSFSYIDVDLILPLPAEFYTSHNINFNSLNSLHDISFIRNDKSWWNQIAISPNDGTLTGWWYMNKCETTKSYVEIISMSNWEFNADALYLKEVFNKVFEKNNIIINEELCRVSSLQNADIKLILRCVDTAHYEDSGEHGHYFDKIFQLCTREGNEQSNCNCKCRGSCITRTWKRNPQNDNFNVSVSNKSSTHTNTNNEYDNVQSMKTWNISNTLWYLADYADFNYIYLNSDCFVNNDFITLRNISNFLTFLKRTTTSVVILNYRYSQRRTLQWEKELLSNCDILLFEQKDFNQLNNARVSGRNATGLEDNFWRDYFNSDTSKRYTSKMCWILEPRKEWKVLSINNNVKEGNNVNYIKTSYSWSTNVEKNDWTTQLFRQEEYKNTFFGVFFGRFIQCVNKNLKIEPSLYLSTSTAIEMINRLTDAHPHSMGRINNDEFYLITFSESDLVKVMKWNKMKDQERQFKLGFAKSESNNLIPKYDACADNHLKRYFRNTSQAKPIKIKACNIKKNKRSTWNI